MSATGLLQRVTSFDKFSENASVLEPTFAIVKSLPKSRVKTFLRVFDQCGLDYADPLYCKSARKTIEW